jgi:hypothetical protein
MRPKAANRRARDFEPHSVQFGCIERAELWELRGYFLRHQCAAALDLSAVYRRKESDWGAPEAGEATEPPFG